MEQLGDQGRVPSIARPMDPDGAPRAVGLVHLNDTEGPAAVIWPQLATAVRALRAQGRCDLLLHAGDAPLGGPGAAQTVRAMNALRFDAMALGNHDLDDGVPTFRAQAAALRVPVLCANIAGPGLERIRAYRLLRRRGLRVAVVGVTLPDLPRYQPPRYTVGLAAHSAVEALHVLVPRLRARAEVVIVLSHCGYDADVELARRVADIDVIVGGHSHHLVAEPVRIGDTWVVQAGAGGAYVGWLAIERGGRQGVSGGVMPTADLEPDARTRALCLPDDAAGADMAIVGYTAVDLSPSAYARETPLGNLTADLMRTSAGADVALLRCATVGTTLRAGPIRRRDRRGLNLCDADQVARLRLTGAEISAVLEHGARNAYFLLTTSGARVTYDAARPAGHRVVAVEIGAAPLQPGRDYLVACSEVLARGVGDYPRLRDTPHELLPHTIGDLLMQHIAARGVIRPVVDGRLALHGRLPEEALGHPDGRS